MHMANNMLTVKFFACHDSESQRTERKSRERRVDVQPARRQVGWHTSTVRGRCHRARDSELSLSPDATGQHLRGTGRASESLVKSRIVSVNGYKNRDVSVRDVRLPQSGGVGGKGCTPKDARIKHNSVELHTNQIWYPRRHSDAQLSAQRRPVALVLCQVWCGPRPAGAGDP